jgi:hypothetical protein
MAIQTRSSLLSRTGLGGAALSGVALAVPLLYALYAAITGGVTLSSNDDITSLFTTGIIITSVASVLALIATGLGLPGAMAAPRRGLATTGTAAGLLVVSALLLFAVLLPRAGAMQNLNDQVAPFAKTVRDTCRSGLNAVTADLTTARDHAKAFATDDVAFAGYMLNDALALNTDQKNLALGIAKLNAVDAPDKYQQLKKDCLASMGGQQRYRPASALQRPGTEGLGHPAPTTRGAGRLRQEPRGATPSRDHPAHHGWGAHADRGCDQQLRVRQEAKGRGRRPHAGYQGHAEQQPGPF